MLNPVPNDDEIERWFARNAETVAIASERTISSVAYWIPVIGIPANDCTRTPTPR